MQRLHDICYQPTFLSDSDGLLRSYRGSYRKPFTFAIFLSSMANHGLVVSGAIISGFALLFLNPMFDIPGMASLNGALPVGSSVDWTVVAFMTFVVVFLTGAVMVGKGFLTMSVAQTRTRTRETTDIPSNATSEKEEPMIS